MIYIHNPFPPLQLFSYTTFNLHQNTKVVDDILIDISSCFCSNSFYFTMKHEFSPNCLYYGVILVCKRRRKFS